MPKQTLAKSCCILLIRCFRKDDFIKQVRLFIITTILAILPLITFAYPVNVELTAYTHTGSVMANGEYPYVGAVASNDYPLGTIVYINGNPYTVADRMASGVHGVIDIFMNSYNEAVNFGRQYTTVYVN